MERLITQLLKSIHSSNKQILKQFLFNQSQKQNKSLQTFNSISKKFKEQRHNSKNSSSNK